jgi:hypothetical protein
MTMSFVEQSFLNLIINDKLYIDIEINYSSLTARGGITKNITNLEKKLHLLKKYNKKKVKIL